MPIRQLPLVTGEIYHIINRGVAQSPIFSTQKDYQRLIETLDYYRFIDVPGKLSRYKSLPIDQRDSIKADLDKNGKKLVEIVAYCLMPNHFHLLLKQLEDGGISQFMRKSSVSYGRYFNTRSDRLGALLQGVFKAIKINCYMLSDIFILILMLALWLKKQSFVDFLGHHCPIILMRDGQI